MYKFNDEINLDAIILQFFPGVSIGRIGMTAKGLAIPKLYGLSSVMNRQLFGELVATLSLDDTIIALRRGGWEVDEGVETWQELISI